MAGLLQSVVGDLRRGYLVRLAPLNHRVTLETVEHAEYRCTLLEDVGLLLPLQVPELLLDLSLVELGLGVLLLVLLELRTLPVQGLHKVLLSHVHPRLNCMDIPDCLQGRDLIGHPLLKGCTGVDQVVLQLPLQVLLLLLGGVLVDGLDDVHADYVVEELTGLFLIDIGLACYLVKQLLAYL